MEACVSIPPVGFAGAGLIPLIHANHTKSSFSGAAILPEESNTRTLSRPFVDRKVTYLKDKIGAEISRYPQYLPENFDYITLSNELAIAIATIDYAKVAVEVTPSSSLKFKLLLKGDKKLIITKPLVNDDLHREEIVFSLFFNKDLLVSDVKNINELVEGLKEFDRKQASHFR